MPKKSKAIKVTDLRGEKPWLKKKNIFKYSTETLDKKKTFLIVCEGQSEEMYFKCFPVLSAQIKAVPLGRSNSALVECAKKLVESEKYDEVWCVFDMDFKPGVKRQYEDYDNSIESAIASGFKCAYSNDAFELWYVLHYEYLDTEQLRKFFFDKLSKYWKLNYEKVGKTRDFAKSIYNLLEEDENASQENAVKNANKLFESKKGEAYHLQNPVTKVFELVEELNLHIRR